MDRLTREQDTFAESWEKELLRKVKLIQIGGQWEN